MPGKKKQSKKKETKQTQKQNQKQVVNINLESKTSSKKKKSKSSTKPVGQMTAEQRYRRAIQAEPFLVQQIPNNNELINSIQSVLNRNNPAVPIPVNVELLERTNRNIENMNRQIKAEEAANAAEARQTPPPPPGLLNTPPASAFRPVPKSPKRTSSRNTPISPPLSLQAGMDFRSPTPGIQEPKPSMFSSITSSVKKTFTGAKTRSKTRETGTTISPIDRGSGRPRNDEEMDEFKRSQGILQTAIKQYEKRKKPQKK